MLPFPMLFSLELFSSSGRIEINIFGKSIFASRDISLVDVTSSVILAGTVLSLLGCVFPEPVPVLQPERYRIRKWRKFRVTTKQVAFVVHIRVRLLSNHKQKAWVSIKILKNLVSSLSRV